MITRILRAAESLFKRSLNEQGLDAAKLQDIRGKLALRKREARMAERRHRFASRQVDTPDGSAS